MLLRDNFDDVDPPNTPDMGLNTSLGTRQTGALAPARYAILPGVWYAAPPASPDTVHVAAGRLEFRGYTAVRLDAPLAFGENGAVEIRATVDPVVGDVASNGWVSFMLSPSPDNHGWVLEPTNVLGILVRSNGAIEVASHGVDRVCAWQQGAPSAGASSFAVVLRVRAQSTQSGRRISLEASLNGSVCTADLDWGPDVRVADNVLLEVGAHFHPGDDMLSVVDDLAVLGRRGRMPPRTNASSAPPPLDLGGVALPRDNGRPPGTHPEAAQPANR